MNEYGDCMNEGSLLQTRLTNLCRFFLVFIQDG